MKMSTVVVPATSANLGPGFDAFALALTLHDELIATEIPSGLEIQVTGEGADSVPRGPEHLVVQAMEAAFAHVGARPTGIRLTCTNAIRSPSIISGIESGSSTPVSTSRSVRPMPRADSTVAGSTA